MTTIESLEEDKSFQEKLPPYIERILKENKNVMPDELTKHLLLRCKVDHQIELEPWAKHPHFPLIV